MLSKFFIEISYSIAADKRLLFLKFREQCIENLQSRFSERKLRAWKKHFVCYVIFVANNLENSNAYSFDFSLLYFFRFFIRNSESIFIGLHLKRAEYLTLS